jgi:hypothetical protein
MRPNFFSYSIVGHYARKAQRRCVLRENGDVHQACLRSCVSHYNQNGDVRPRARLGLQIEENKKNRKQRDA